MKTDAIYCCANHDFEYRIKKKETKINNERVDNWGIVICDVKNPDEVLYEDEDVSDSWETAAALVNLLTENQVEPNQAGYVIEDFIANIHTFNLK